MKEDNFFIAVNKGEDKLEHEFGCFGNYWERWADTNFPSQGGIMEDVKKFMLEYARSIKSAVVKDFVETGVIYECEVCGELQKPFWVSSKTIVLRCFAGHIRQK